MTIWCVLSRRRNALGTNDVGQWQAQEIFIELPGLLGIDAAPSHVVEILEKDLSGCTVDRGHCDISGSVVDCKDEDASRKARALNM